MRSLLAFWMGGAMSTAAVPPSPLNVLVATVQVIQPRSYGATPEQPGSYTLVPE